MAKPIKILIPDGESPVTPMVIDCLVKAKVVSLIIILPYQKPSIRYSKIVKACLYFDSKLEPNAWFAFIQKTIETFKIDVVLPMYLNTERYSYFYQHKGSLTASVVYLPPPGIFQLANNKATFTRWMTQHGFAHPATIFGDELNAPSLSNGLTPDAFKQIQFPVLLKPNLRYGGLGIYKLDTFEALVTHLKAMPNDSLQSSIIQTYIEGFDLGCGALCKDGTILVQTTQSYFGEFSTDFTTPFAIKMEYNIAVVELITNLVKLLNWSGPINIDLRFEKSTGKIYILEINPRFWRSVTASNAAGVNFPYLTCLLALGKPFPTLQYKHIKYTPSSIALKQYMRNILQPINRNKSYYHSPISTWVADPLPKLVDMYRKIMKV